jgi:ATP-dependent protease HslVU (ClpYQ) peptidase subunit
VTHATTIIAVRKDGEVGSRAACDVT